MIRPNELQHERNTTSIWDQSVNILRLKVDAKGIHLCIAVSVLQGEIYFSSMIWLRKNTANIIWIHQCRVRKDCRKQGSLRVFISHLVWNYIPTRQPQCVSLALPIEYNIHWYRMQRTKASVRLAKVSTALSTGKIFTYLIKSEFCKYVHLQTKFAQTVWITVSSFHAVVSRRRKQLLDLT